MVGVWSGFGGWGGGGGGGWSFDMSDGVVLAGTQSFQCSAQQRSLVCEMLLSLDKDLLTSFCVCFRMSIHEEDPVAPFNIP